MNNKLLTAFSFAILSGSVAFAQKPIRYEVSFPNYTHHEAEISLTASELKDGPVQFRMSRSSPGRYATHEFGKNVYNVQAFDANGQKLKLVRIQGDLYEVAEHKGTIKISYTLYGTHADGTYADIDETQAHLNIPASFMWVVGKDANPIEVKFEIPEKLKWKVATQLKPLAEKNTYYAPNFQYFMDSPTELSNHFQRSWEVKNPDGKEQTIKLALHAVANDQEVDRYAGMLKKVVAEQQMVFGEFPDYDFGNYTFIQNVNLFVNGDGMEHRNSTMITEQELFRGKEEDLLSTVSHEYFHQWNVERIRPKTLEPFDFTHANMSNELWFAEGFTNYYGILLLKRSGFYSLDKYAQKLNSCINSVLVMPGAKQYSPVTMSNQAVFVDAGVAIDETNYSNMFVSYYPYGEATALALDLRLRTEFKNLNLDKFMQLVWQKHGKTEIPYVNADIQNLLAQFTGNKVFADDFFNRFIYASEKNNYEQLLGNAGLLLRKAGPGRAWLGNVMFQPIENVGLQIASATQIGSPLYESGLDINDIIIAIDEQLMKTPADLQQLLARHKPGDKITIDFDHRGITKTVSVELKENPRLEVVTYENANKPVTAEMKKLREDWLGSKVKQSN
ncbi:M61 family metallopeptidase [Solitalea canadensis]|uniref:Putative protease with the C-terminal PDZ domain n=1 Tax=Solitalea canadensis (strain ATCC 29591 / DSM 3403 / JCM 21819 / LMG 8368 / NBRC 15130 / NCIMB 12057 / USAM 9D) TaxID=929556 RepID=H8KSL3_SOLCM|nr:PDZ domain-containing protein [Solitalea canadensis]AFD08564.1 putative protease with the C-terminal PDZ domain [Solitalea canadensis DSM 3403]